ncbi:MAG: phosphate butyryltransferase [Eubacterium sp.]|jgi:Phosphotransacetylase|nr:phosphate butyryltransferase [Eubacterium sp.]
MRYTSFHDLTEKIKSRSGLSRCAVAGADDIQTINAVVRAKKEHIIEPLLIGNLNAMREILVQKGESLSDYTLLEQTSSENGAQLAVNLVNDGKADCIMKGLIETGHLMHVIMKKENNMRTGRLISAMSVMEAPFYHKLIFMSDAGICMYPDLGQKKEIIRNAVDAMRKMGIDNPKVAVLCAIEYLNPKMPETADAAALKEMNKNGEIGNCIIEGPISYDVAMYKHAAEQKHFHSSVAGDPDLLVWPDITTGNIASKIMDHSAGGKGGGLVIGTKVPIILTSRGDDADGKYRCIVLGAAFHRE